VKALEVQGIDVFYRDVQAVWDVSFDVESGEIVTLVGANGAGKTTTLRTVAGLLRPRRGSIRFQGEDVTGMPAFKLVQRGLVLVPEARQLWGQMTVRENLDMGAYGREARKSRHETLRTVLEMFPILEKRAKQNAGTLSGGEQQMCAIGRGLMARPKLLMLDEPSLGLAPMLVRQVFSALREINGRGVTVLLVEQNVHQALALANRGFVLETGHLTLSGQTKALLGDPRVKEKFLGEAAL
jgi:branched-chain amino acid transport system ATP-binding protein